MAKQFPIPLRLIVHMNFSLKNYSCDGRESRNVSDKYTWDNSGDLKQLSMDQTVSEDNRSD